MKTKIILGGAFVALATTAPAVLQAQPLPAPVIAVVNTDQIFSTCTVCTAAQAQIQAQANTLQQRVQTLQTQIQAEGTALEPLVANQTPEQIRANAALATRIQNFQTMQQNAEREIAQSRERVQRNLNFVRQQIGQRIQPALQTVSAQRGATIVIDSSQALISSPALDITAPVLAIVNQNTTPLNVNAPAPTPAPAAAGRPATPAPATPNRPRPQGR
jgi:Skp family chaperone for outer membrane proteins